MISPELVHVLLSKHYDNFFLIQRNYKTYKCQFGNLPVFINFLSLIPFNFITKEVLLAATIT